MTVNPLTGNKRLTALHFLVWTLILAISFFSMISDDGVVRSGLFAINNCCFYAFVIYGNIGFLYPRFFQTKRYALYLPGVIVLLCFAALGRGYISTCIHDPAFAAAPRWLGLQAHIGFLFSIISVFILSFVFRLAMAYFVV